LNILIKHFFCSQHLWDLGIAKNANAVLNIDL